MTHDDFKILLERRIAKTVQVLDSKNKEYSRKGDKLHNFKRAAALQKTTPETALLGMLSKHLVSIVDMIHDLDELMDIDSRDAHSNQTRARMLDSWNEKLGDSINYLILLEGLVTERLQVRPITEEEEQISQEEQDKIPF